MTTWKPRGTLLARADAHGAPYVIPAWLDGKRVPIDYGMAVAICA